jgi:hypothetical protein
MFVVFAVLVYSVKAIINARGARERSDRERAYVSLEPEQVNV